MTGVLAFLVFTSVPGLVLMLIVFSAIDRMGLAASRRLRLPWRKGEAGRPMAATGIDEMHAIFYATRRQELDQRRTSLMLRDEENDGAPPRGRIDLDAGTATIRRRHGNP